MNPRLVLAAAATLGSLAYAQNAAASTTVGGGAFAIKANVSSFVAPVNVGPLASVTLPSTGGGPFTASLLNTNVLGLVAVQAGNVSTQGDTAAGTAASSANVANVSVAGIVSAQVATSSCTATASSATGSSRVLGLVVAGIPISVVDIGPNTKISLPVGTVTINEQTTTPTGITVNAVDVQLNAFGLLTGNVTLAQSHCSVG
ncbi:MAG TPA: choice-of-anchor P family protein [Solirubrobacteraceae bacterium]|nr:choice-of-anchor P family protein [Solirubrobacteraceae bacterium]